MKYKSFKDYYLKSAIWKIGLPWGLFAGILFAISQDKYVLKYFISINTVLLLVLFILGSFVFAFSIGKYFWRRHNNESEA